MGGSGGEGSCFQKKPNIILKMMHSPKIDLIIVNLNTVYKRKDDM